MRKTLKFGFLCAALAILALPAIAQNECQSLGLYSIPAFQVSDAVGLQHQGACWNGTTVKITLPLTTLGGAVAFSSVTAGTNGSALVVGTGGSLATSGTGTITANALAATVTVPLAGTTFNPATGATTTFSSGSNSFNLESTGGNLFMGSGGSSLQGGIFGTTYGIVSVGGSVGGSSCNGVALGTSTNASFFVDPATSCEVGNVTGPYAGLAGQDDAGDVFIFQSGLFSITTPIQAQGYQTTTNCAVNSVSPAACGSAAAGAVVVPTATATYTVRTTAVTAASRIFLMPMSFAGNLPGTPTCVTPLITSEPTVSAISTGVSFTFIFTATTGQTCWQYWIVN
jgi:hypothetical protein